MTSYLSNLILLEKNPTLCVQITMIVDLGGFRSVSSPLVLVVLFCSTYSKVIQVRIVCSLYSSCHSVICRSLYEFLTFTDKIKSNYMICVC